MEYNTFISYSRAEASNEAMLIYYALKERGISVFIDVRDQATGKFPSKLRSIIENCKNVIIVLQGDTLQKCTNDSWPAIELLLAAETKKKIIPVVFPNNNSDYSNIASELKPLHIENMQSVEYIHEHSDSAISQIIDMIDNPISKLACVDLLLDKLSSHCKINKLGQFILNCSEMRMEANGEVHLLTDDLENYDFTVIAEMAISTNLRKNIKYIYYCPSQCITEFVELKSRMKWYLMHSKQALTEIDRWTRSNYMADAQAKNWLQRINKTSIHTLWAEHFHDINGIDMIKSTLDKLSFTDVRTDKEQILDITVIIKWLDGDIVPASRIKNYIENLKAISDVLLDGKIAQSRQYISEWIKYSNFLNKVLQMSEWIQGDIPDSPEIESFMNQIDIDDQILMWLHEKPLSEQEADETLKNLYLCKFDSNDLSIIPCYNFSLLLTSDGATIASGWYKTSDRVRDQDSQSVKDNMLLISGLNSAQRKLIKDVFITIQNSKPSFKNSVKSVIFAQEDL